MLCDACKDPDRVRRAVAKGRRHHPQRDWQRARVEAEDESIVARSGSGKRQRASFGRGWRHDEEGGDQEADCDNADDADRGSPARDRMALTHAPCGSAGSGATRGLSGLDAIIAAEEAAEACSGRVRGQAPVMSQRDAAIVAARLRKAARKPGTSAGRGFKAPRRAESAPLASLPPGDSGTAAIAADQEGRAERRPSPSSSSSDDTPPCASPAATRRPRASSDEALPALSQADAPRSAALAKPASSTSQADGSDAFVTITEARSAAVARLTAALIYNTVTVPGRKQQLHPDRAADIRHGVGVAAEAIADTAYRIALKTAVSAVRGGGAVEGSQEHIKAFSGVISSRVERIKGLTAALPINKSGLVRKPRVA